MGVFMFSINGKLFKTLSKAGDFFILEFLVIVFSIPLITAGASMTAAYYVGMKLVRDEEGYVFRDFIKSWKQNLKQSIIIELTVIVLAFLLITDVRICHMWAVNEGNTFARILMFAALGMCLVLCAAVLYVFPMLAKFENKVVAIMKNAVILCMHHFLQTIIIIFINGGRVIFTINFWTAFIVTIPLSLYVNSFILSRVFLIYAKNSNTADVYNNSNNPENNNDDNKNNENSDNDNTD